MAKKKKGNCVHLHANNSALMHVNDVTNNYPFCCSVFVLAPLFYLPNNYAHRAREQLLKLHIRVSGVRETLAHAALYQHVWVIEPRLKYNEVGALFNSLDNRKFSSLQGPWINYKVQTEQLLTCMRRRSLARTKMTDASNDPRKFSSMKKMKSKLCPDVCRGSNLQPVVLALLIIHNYNK